MDPWRFEPSLYAVHFLWWVFKNKQQKVPKVKQYSELAVLSKGAKRRGQKAEWDNQGGHGDQKALLMGTIQFRMTEYSGATQSWLCWVAPSIILKND